MSSKPIYQGTIEQYNALPWNIKQYYSAPPNQPTPETPLSPTYSRSQAKEAIITGQPIIYYPTEKTPPLIPEGYKITDVELTEQGIELTMQPTTPTTVSVPAPTVPTHMNDPISKQVFKGIAETQKMQADPTGYIVKKTLEIGAAATGLAAPALAVKGAIIGVGITQGLIGATQQRALSPTEVREAALGGAAFSGASSVVFGVTGVAAMTGITGVAARAGASAGLVGGAGYLVSGGKLEALGYGAALGAGLSVGGEALGYLYPRYIRPTAVRAYEKLFPERSVIKNALGEQSMPQLSLKERLLGQKAPTDVYEKLLYKRATGPIKSTPAKDIISTREIGTTYKTPSGFAQQSLIVKQATVQKTPFLSTLQLAKQTPTAAYALTRTVAPETKTVQKQDQKTIQRQVLSTTLQYSPTQQIANPMLQYQGKPYFSQRQREREEYAYIVYPAQSPFTAPALINQPRTLVQPFQRSTPKSLLKDLLEQAPSTTSSLTQSQNQLTDQIVNQKQIQRQVQEQLQTQTQKQKQQTRWDLGGGFDMTPGFRRLNSKIFGKYGRYRREYPLLSAKQMLKKVLE